MSTHCRTGTGEDRLDEIRRLLRHPPPAATGTDRAAFTRQRHEALERAVVAPHAEKAMAEQPGPKEGANSRSMKSGHVSARGAAARKGSRCSWDDPMQDRVGGGARDVGSHGARPSGWRAVAPAVPLDVRTACNQKPSRRGATPGATERCAAGPVTGSDRRDRYRARARPNDQVLGNVVVLRRELWMVTFIDEEGLQCPHVEAA